MVIRDGTVGLTQTRVKFKPGFEPRFNLRKIDDAGLTESQSCRNENPILKTISHESSHLKSMEKQVIIII